MLYKDGVLLDLQGQPIKSQAVRVVRGYQKRAVERLTPGEQAFCRLIGPLASQAGVRYVKQVIFYIAPGISFRSDFVYRDFRLIIEIDGGSHHGREEHDQWRDDVLLRLARYETLRLTDEDCMVRFSATRLRVIDRLIACEEGYKKKLVRYRKTLLGDPTFISRLKSQ